MECAGMFHPAILVKKYSAATIIGLVGDDTQQMAFHCPLKNGHVVILR